MHYLIQLIGFSHQVGMEGMPLFFHQILQFIQKVMQDQLDELER
jgi:HPt (histidine-containing phosphotransfer) domain-containing protein